MPNQTVVSREQWTTARKALLAEEKEFTQLREKLSRKRRELPWVKLEKNYTFDTPLGKRSLANLFQGRSQLIVYHFMFTPGWVEGCRSCSYLMDHVDGMIPHLAARDVTFTAISRAPIEDIAAFKKRMGWRFDWASSGGNDFNFDYHVSVSNDDWTAGKFTYNYNEGPVPGMEDWPGLSVFYKDVSGEIYHTYSTYSRGLDILIGTYNYLDLVPKGRDEDRLNFSMAWVRHHDQYDRNYVVDPQAGYIQPQSAPCPHCAAETR